MKKKGLFKNNSAAIPSDANLNITPMASVFVVTLVFLLKNMTMGVSAVTPTQDLSLPQMSESDELFEGLRVEVAKDSIAVNGTLVMPLNQFQVDPLSIDSGGGLKALSEAIKKQEGISSESLARGPASERFPADTKSKRRVLVMADVNTPYSTLKRVFTSTANEGYELLKLVVIHEGN